MTRETKSYELKIYDQSLMRFEAAYDAFGSLKLEITDIDSANAHLLPLNLIVDQDEKSLASWMEGRTIPKNRAFVEQILSTAGLTRNDILGILDVSKGFPSTIRIGLMMGNQILPLMESICWTVALVKYWDL